MQVSQSNIVKRSLSASEYVAGDVKTEEFNDSGYKFTLGDGTTIGNHTNRRLVKGNTYSVRLQLGYNSPVS